VGREFSKSLLRLASVLFDGAQQRMLMCGAKQVQIETLMLISSPNLAWFGFIVKLL
jgi:hypothetical protein